MSTNPNAQGIVECPDGHRCENGSLCVENPYDEGNYYCDCDAAFLDSAYQGLYCEHEATEYCSYKGAVSRNSFCTNGGTCIAEVGEGEAHLGCSCPDEYEGDHCQFVKGTQPESWPDGSGSGQGGASGTKGASASGGGGGGGGGQGLSGGAIFGVVVAAVAVVLVAAFFVRRSLNRKKGGMQPVETAGGTESPPITPKVVTEHNLDPDGGTLEKPPADDGFGADENGEIAMDEEETEII